MYGKKLKELRKLEGWTQEEVAKKIGVSKQTYSHYEKENRKPGFENIRKLAEVYNVDMNAIFGDRLERSTPESQAYYQLPIVGQIACGEKEIAYEHIEGYEEVPKTWLNGAEYFFLQAKGDSMINARIHEGDLLLIRQQNDVENGEIAAVMVNGEATLKRVYKSDDSIIFQPENSKYAPLVVNKNDGSDVRIIGKLVRTIIKF